VPGENIVAVYLRRLSRQKQARLTELMDKNNEGRLSRSERSELKRLGFEVDRMLLANSQALAHALRPELFDDQGRLMMRRFRQEPGGPAIRRSEQKQGNGRR
jgi:hypothetical protein